MGNMLLKAEETAEGFVYVVDGGVTWIVDYTGASVESLCFPLINGEKVGVDFSELGTSDLSLFSAVETVDLTIIPPTTAIPIAIRPLAPSPDA